MINEPTIKYSVLLPKSLHKAVKQAALDNEGSMQVIVRRGVEIALAQVTASRHDPIQTGEAATPGSVRNAQNQSEGPQLESLGQKLDLAAAERARKIILALTTAAENIQAARKEATGLLNAPRAKQGPKVPASKSHPAVKAKRLLGRAKERGSGTEGL